MTSIKIHTKSTITLGKALDSSISIPEQLKSDIQAIKAIEKAVPQQIPLF